MMLIDRKIKITRTNNFETEKYEKHLLKKNLHVHIESTLYCT